MGSVPSAWSYVRIGCKLETHYYTWQNSKTCHAGALKGIKTILKKLVLDQGDFLLEFIAQKLKKFHRLYENAHVNLHNNMNICIYTLMFLNALFEKYLFEHKHFCT